VIAPAVLTATVTVAVVLVMMLVELWVSVGNERRLRARGAVGPPDSAYGAMRLAYPATFVAMGIEGALSAPPSEPLPGVLVVAGAAVFVLGKLLKVWAIVALGPFWTYKVLVVPGETLVTRGPYAWMRHPNYVGVVGELIGVALITGARVTGPLSVVVFGWLLWRRIQAEEQALGLRP
jgi:methyltransferase